MTTKFFQQQNFPDLRYILTYMHTCMLIADDRPPVLNEIIVLKTEIYTYLVVMTLLGLVYTLFFLVFEAVFRNRK